MGHRYFDRTGCIHFFLHPVVDLSDEAGNRSVGMQLVIETHKIPFVNPLFPNKFQSTSDNISVYTVSDELIVHEMKFYMFWIFVLWMTLDTVISGPVISNAGM